MSEQLWLALLSVLVTLLMAIFGWLGRMTWAKIAKLEERIEELLGDSDFAAFKAKDAEREKQWTFWREEVNDRLGSKRLKLEDHEHRLTRLERNGH